MKKNKFFRGLSAKLALAVVALTTVFTSCEKEDFEIQVVTNPAEVNIVADVVYIDLAAGTSTDVTGLADLTFSGATKEGTKGVIKGTEANPTIPATTVTVTATYNGKTGTKTIAVNELKSGKVTYTATIILISDVPAPEEEVEYELIVKADGTPTVNSPVTVWGTPDASHNGYTHDGHIWNENASEYFVDVKITYPIIKKATVTSWDIVAEGADALQLETLINGYNKDESKYNETMTYTASAYCIYAAYITTTTTTTKYNVEKVEKGATTGGTVVAKFTVDEVTSTEAQVVESAHPSHDGHYHAGHGHNAHGDSSNAGGGITIAD